MGDRVSVSFVRDAEDWQGQMCRSESVALFSHSGGLGFVDEAVGYARKLVKEMTKDGLELDSSWPLTRLEPATVMVDFIRAITDHDDRVLYDLYLGADSGNGDNSDNGHYCIHLDTTDKSGVPIKVWEEMFFTEKHWSLKERRELLNQW